MILYQIPLDYNINRIWVHQTPHSFGFSQVVTPTTLLRTPERWPLRFDVSDARDAGDVLVFVVVWFCF